VIQEIEARRLLERPFIDLEARDPYEIGRLLREESSAVGAVVLAHLDPETSANVLKVFPPEDAIEVVKRVASLEPPNPQLLRTIAADLMQRLDAAPPSVGDADPAARLKTVAEVLNNSSPEMEKAVIESIADDDDEMARELREFMFTWEDIATIDSRTMQRILGTVDTKTLSIALKSCSEDVEENLLGNLSVRVREMIADERELAGAVPRNEVEMARDEIMRSIRVMIEAGEFRPSKGGDDLVS
jgi:flagellar motor switch protein FliG